ncbi:hypothetical protein PpBr36_04280 [Pyricularia pennisetigena]|uniref:hypothetical protein n=1 Tax=Pyricularia pennisetigena TaxID=1578925 RepID=UPI001151E427|nr:hypothetical protein PpBr36_04280 [Pyricularia pennisetigena]TLS26749.1 hypothetical protein PpBr36_04280 [Pyricularia pennisetigena]
MKSATAAVLILIVIPAALACCRQNTLTSCCGKGKCNIFCCNCDGGCKPKDQCWGISQPICWAGPNNVYCARSVGAEASSKPSDFHDAAEGSLGSSVVGLSAEERRAEDVKVFNKVDVDGKGFFTYGEFLGFAGEPDSEALEEYFAKFDRNGDGVINVDEMRLE